jgi:hypothetical protein
MEGNIKLGGEISLRRTKRCANKRRKYLLGENLYMVKLPLRELNVGLQGGGGEGGESSRRGSDGLGDSVPDARRQGALRGTAELEHELTRLKCVDV